MPSLFLTGLLALLLAALAPAEGKKLYPVDEAKKDPSFAAFRERLVMALRARDSEALLAIVDSKIRTSFGDDGGMEGFKKQWKPQDPQSPVWRELAELLGLGGTFGYQGVPGFWAPYVYSRWPAEIDAFEHAAILRRDVTLRARPASDAPILASLSYDIVKVTPGEPVIERHAHGPRQWRQIVTPSGTRGYVQTVFLRSPIDYRAHFRKSRGAWKMDLLVAGD